MAPPRGVRLGPSARNCVEGSRRHTAARAIGHRQSTMGKADVPRRTASVLPQSTHKRALAWGPPATRGPGKQWGPPGSKGRAAWWGSAHGAGVVRAQKCSRGAAQGWARAGSHAGPRGSSTWQGATLEEWGCWLGEVKGQKPSRGTTHAETMRSRGPGVCGAAIAGTHCAVALDVAATGADSEDEPSTREGRRGKGRATARKGRPKSRHRSISWDELITEVKSKVRRHPRAASNSTGDPREGTARYALQLLGLPEELLSARARHYKSPQDHPLPADCEDGGESTSSQGAAQAGTAGVNSDDDIIAVLEALREFEFEVSDVRDLARTRPQALRRGGAYVREKLGYMLALGIPRASLPRAARQSRWTRLDVRDELPEKAAYLERIGVSEVGRALDLCPSLIGIHFSRFQECEDTLSSILGMDDFRWLVAQNPRVLTFQQEPTGALVGILTREYCFQTDALAALFKGLSWPPCGDDALFRQRLAAVRGAVGEAAVAAVLQRFPLLLCCSPEGMEEVGSNLRSVLGEAGAVEALLRDPRLLACSWRSKIQPALEYLTQFPDVAPEDVFRTNAYARSLDGIVVPRMEFLKAAQVRVVPLGHRRTGSSEGESISLRRVANATEFDFKQCFPEYRGR